MQGKSTCPGNQIHQALCISSALLSSEWAFHVMGIKAVLSKQFFTQVFLEKIRIC